MATFFVRSARTYSNRCKPGNTPDSGKCIARGKDVHYELESERSWRKNIWPDEQKLDIRLVGMD